MGYEFLCHPVLQAYNKLYVVKVCREQRDSAKFRLPIAQWAFLSRKIRDRAIIAAAAALRRRRGGHCAHCAHIRLTIEVMKWGRLTGHASGGRARFRHPEKQDCAKKLRGMPHFCGWVLSFEYWRRAGRQDSPINDSS